MHFANISYCVIKFINILPKEKKLAATLEHTSWERVAARMRDLYNLPVTATECAQRFERTSRAFGPSEDKVRSTRSAPTRRRFVRFHGPPPWQLKASNKA